MLYYYKKIVLISILCVCVSSVGCGKDGKQPQQPKHPHMLMLPEHRALVLSRIDREPYDMILSKVYEMAAYEHQPGDPEEWGHGEEGHNAEGAQANAFLAYIYEDEDAGRKAVEFLDRVRTDFETNQVFDVNIRIPHAVIGYINAWDLLKATPYITGEEADNAKARIVELVDKFFSAYIEGPWSVILLPTQNNYNIRTSAAIAYAAIAFPDVPQWEKWWNFSLSELGLMFGPESHYIQDDGGVSEGPFYFGFALSGAIPALIAYDNTFGEPSVVSRDCKLRTEEPPWDDISCVEGEPYTFSNPLYTERFQNSLDWTMKIRLPSGDRPPVGDANFNPTNSIGLYTGILGEPRYAWDWIENERNPYAMRHGMSLEMYYLIYFDDGIGATEPPWSPTQLLPDAGNAVFRSDWGGDAIWFMMMAESGPVRMTVHDHVDGTSFQMYAYGEYLAMDTGYYKPSSNDNAVTAHAWNHNLVLIDGEGPPDKGLLTTFGDTDCYLENTYDGEIFDYAEARTNYQETDVVRSALFVRDRYVVISDFLDASTEHEYRFRVHGYGGYDSGGTYTSTSTGSLLGGRWEREKAGFDLSVTSTGGPSSFIEPTQQGDKIPGVHKFETDRQLRNHVVIDAVIDGVDISYIAALYPYKTGTVNQDEMPANVQVITAPAKAAALMVTNANGKRDLIIANRTGGTVAITFPGDIIVETDGRFAFVGLDDSPQSGFVVRGISLKVDGNPLTLKGDKETFALRER